VVPTTAETVSTAGYDAGVPGSRIAAVVHAIVVIDVHVVVAQTRCPVKSATAALAVGSMSWPKLTPLRLRTAAPLGGEFALVVPLTAGAS
jgi:hypothetical protein